MDLIFFPSVFCSLVTNQFVWHFRFNFEKRFLNMRIYLDRRIAQKIYQKPCLTHFKCWTPKRAKNAENAISTFTWQTATETEIRPKCHAKAGAAQAEPFPVMITFHFVQLIVPAGIEGSYSRCCHMRRQRSFMTF